MSMPTVTMLLKEGLLDRAYAFLSVPTGYHGLTGVLVLLAFLFMVQVRNPEALHQEAPGEKAIPGLDHCPEAKTLRRKIRALASDLRQVRNRQDPLALSTAERRIADPCCHRTFCDFRKAVYFSGIITEGRPCHHEQSGRHL